MQKILLILITLIMYSCGMDSYDYEKILIENDWFIESISVEKQSEYQIEEVASTFVTTFTPCSNHAKFENSGNFSFLDEIGNVISGTWSVEQDTIILSKTETSLSTLDEKYSCYYDNETFRMTSERNEIVMYNSICM